MTGWTRCTSCNGSGLQIGSIHGEPVDCHACQGSGMERLRDARGRFATQPDNKLEDDGQPDEAQEWRDFDPDC